jgi:transcription factor TGA
VTADSTDDSESSSKNNSNHSDQHGAAADMQSQFDQVSQQQQLQHKVGISVDASHFFL